MAVTHDKTGCGKGCKWDETCLKPKDLDAAIMPIWAAMKTAAITENLVSRPLEAALSGQCTNARVVV